MLLTSWQTTYKDPATFIIQASSMNLDDAWMPFPIGMQYLYGHVKEFRNTQIGSHEQLVLCAINPKTDQHRRSVGKNRQSIVATLAKNGIHNTSTNTYFQDLPSYKFIVSPEGNGIDCHRHYEALMAGCIPIIERNPLIEEKYKGCPILWTDDYSDITPDYLNHIYHEMSHKVYDFSRLFMNYYDFATQCHIKQCGDFWMNRLINRCWYNTRNHKLGVSFNGGLGNQLFQLAALHHLAKKTDRVPCLNNTSYSSPHSSIPYLKTIFAKWSTMPIGSFEYHVNEGGPRNYIFELADIIKTKSSTLLNGFFQDYRYVEPDFVNTLILPTDCLAKYPDIESKVFIHVRGGDYVGLPDWDIGFDKYYRLAISKFPGASFVIFTNDEPYLLKRPWLEGLDYQIIRENELDTLMLMSKCVGAICTNSTFSWWGAWLNRNRTIIFPSRWVSTSHPNTYKGLYFPEVQTCEVD